MVRFSSRFESRNWRKGENEAAAWCDVNVDVDAVE